MRVDVMFDQLESKVASAYYGSDFHTQRCQRGSSVYRISASQVSLLYSVNAASFGCCHFFNVPTEGLDGAFQCYDAVKEKIRHHNNVDVI
jgi:hypothetical protein